MSYQDRMLQYMMGQQGQERADATLNLQGLMHRENLGENARQFNEGMGMGYDELAMQALNQLLGAQGQDFQQQLAAAGLNEDFLNNAFGRNQQLIGNALATFMPPQPIDTYSPAQMEQNRAINQAQLDQGARQNRMGGLMGLANIGLGLFNPISGIFGQDAGGIMGGLGSIFGGGSRTPPFNPNGGG